MAVKTGRMKGQTYYSDTLPKGEGDKNLKYDKRLYDLAEMIYYKPDVAHPDSVRVLQNELLKIGYLDENNPKSTDGMIGPMTMGASLRYLSNFSNDALWQDVKGKWNSLWGE